MNFWKENAHTPFFRTFPFEEQQIEENNLQQMGENWFWHQFVFLSVDDFENTTVMLWNTFPQFSFVGCERTLPNASFFYLRTKELNRRTFQHIQMVTIGTKQLLDDGNFRFRGFFFPPNNESTPRASQGSPTRTFCCAIPKLHTIQTKTQKTFSVSTTQKLFNSKPFTIRI